MNYVLERLTDPEIEPLTLAEMKTHLRMFTDQTTDDALVTGLIKGGREWIEDETGRALIDQTWRLTIFAAPLAVTNTVRDPVTTPGYSTGSCELTNRGDLLLRRSPILAITSVKTVDATGALTTVDPTTYQLREAESKWPRIFALNGAIWGGDLRIEFRAGFADRDLSPVQGGESVPEVLKQGIKLWAEANYDRDPKTMELYLRTARDLVRSQSAELGVA